MATNGDFDVVASTVARIDDALRRNSRLEVAIIIMLVLLFVVGLGLLIAAAVVGSIPVAITGGVVELSIAAPIARLVQLRRENVRLQILPDLIRFADEVDGQQSKELVFRLVVHLIEQL